MEATELRIGNYARVHVHKTPVRIEEITSRTCTIDNHMYPLEIVNPILLTEDLILRLGTVDERGEWKQEFEKCMDADNNDILLSEYTLDSDGVVSMQVCLRLLNDGFYLVDVQNESGDVASLPIDLKHLHQFQNLYFALTGRDLTLKP